MCVCAGWCSRPVRSSWAACLCLWGSLWSWGSTWLWLAYFRDSFQKIPGSPTSSVSPTVSSIIHLSITDDTRRTRLATRYMDNRSQNVFQNSGEMLLVFCSNTHTHFIWAILETALVVEERQERKSVKRCVFSLPYTGWFTEGLLYYKHIHTYTHIHTFWALLWWKPSLWSRVCQVRMLFYVLMEVQWCLALVLSLPKESDAAAL